MALYSLYKTFLLNLLILPRKKNISGYIIMSASGKTFFEHRIIMELFLDRMLLEKEIVHHIDYNKSNNKISNLQVMDANEHLSMHHTGLKKPTINQNPPHKLSKEKINKIKELSKTILKKNGKANYSKIAKEVGVAGFTVARHLK